MRKIKSCVIFLIVIALCFCFTACGNKQESATPKTEANFSDWNLDAPALSALQNYVKSVTDEKSADYIPVQDRIAVFDMDGTLLCETAPIYFGFMLYLHRVLEDPSYQPTEDVKAMAEQIRTGIETGNFPETLEEEHAPMDAKAFAGMTLAQYDQYVKDYAKTNVAGLTNLTYADSWYKPMLQVVDYLNANDFTVYICSGADRFMVRAVADGKVAVAPEHIIGMDAGLEASGQHGASGFAYTFAPGDDVVRTDKNIFKPVKTNKVSEIAKEIGRQPVLSFGNSGGDISMNTYVTSGNPYKSAAFMVLADDDVREFGNIEKAAKNREKWESYGWNVISMKNDFRTIYGDNVTKK